MNTTTRIAGRDIPIADGGLSVVHFSMGKSGADEAGDWEFWSAFDGSRSVTGRCRQGVDPGERFRRMEGLEDYEDAWEIARSALCVRPAVEKSIVGWLNSHREDAQFAEFCQIGSRKLRVVTAEDGFALSEDGPAP